MAIKLTVGHLDSNEVWTDVVMQDMGQQGPANTYLSLFDLPGVGRVESLFVGTPEMIDSGELGMARLEFDRATLAEYNLDAKRIALIESVADIS